MWNSYEWAIIQKSIELLSAYDGKILKEEDKIRLVEELYLKESLKGTEFLQELDKALRYFDDISMKPFSMKKRNTGNDERHKYGICNGL